MRHRGFRAGLWPATSAIAFASAAWAGETITYSYDSLGRLTRVERSGTVNSGVTAYSYDAADNRTNVTVALAGAPPPPPPPPPPPSPPPLTRGGGGSLRPSSPPPPRSRSPRRPPPPRPAAAS